MYICLLYTVNFQYINSKHYFVFNQKVRYTKAKVKYLNLDQIIIISKCFNHN